MLPGLMTIAGLQQPTIYKENFGTHSVAAGLPSGFTARWNTTGISYAIQSEGIAGSDSGKEFAVTSTSDLNRSISFDAAGNGHADVDVVISLYMRDSEVTDGAAQSGIVVRSNASAANPTGYVFTLEGEADTPHAGGDEIRLVKHVSGTATNLVSASFAWLINTRYWMRFRVVGSTLKARIWAKGSAEPGTWNLETTDASVAAAGYVGFYDGFAEGDPVYDYIRVEVL